MLGRATLPHGSYASSPDADHMDPQLQTLLEHLVTDEEGSIFVTGADATTRRATALAILDARRDVRDTVVVESAPDWERAPRADAVVIPELTTLDDERQRTLVGWLTDDGPVVAAGVDDPNAAVRAEELRVDLHYELSAAPLPLDGFDAFAEAPPEEVVERAAAAADEREADSERRVPPAWLARWCERADLAPTRAWCHDHLERRELWTLETGATSPTEAREKLRHTADGEDGHPVVTDGRDDVDRLLQRQHFDHETFSPRTADWRLDDWLEAAAGVDLERWIERQIERAAAEGLGPEYFEPDALEPPDGVDDEPTVRRQEDHATVTVVPVDSPADVPAFFHFGFGNANPTPDRHVAMLRRWARRWNATLFGIGTDWLELTVTDPVADPETALEIAREHFVYCPDAPGANIAKFAQSILGASYWSFRWS